MTAPLTAWRRGFAPIPRPQPLTERDQRIIAMGEQIKAQRRDDEAAGNPWTTSITPDPAPLEQARDARTVGDVA